MRKSPLAVVMFAISIVGLCAFAGLWWYQTKPVEEAPPLDPTPVVFDMHSLTVRKRPFPPPLPLQGTEEHPSQGVTPILARETQPVLRNTDDATIATSEMQPVLVHTEDSPEEILSAFKTEVCACLTVACLIEVNDHYTSKLVLAWEVDRGDPEIKELLSEVRGCQEAVRGEGAAAGRES